MSSELVRVKRRRETRKEIESLYERADQVLLIHYSCESFYDIKDGRTPRVTSIAIRNLKTAQTESFSVHKIAERRGNEISEIPHMYDALEKEMLDEFFEYVKYRMPFNFVHWNMRDGNYGFSAVEHRYQTLGGKPHIIPDDKKFDLARALVSLYGRRYVSHGDHGRLLAIIRLNKITDKDVLTGGEEAQAFEGGEYIKLHQSTLRKIDCLANIFERTADNSLVTNATWQDKYGFHPKIIIEYAKNHWIWSLIVMIGVIIGIVARFLGIF